jgi:hypothetical protein
MDWVTLCILVGALGKGEKITRYHTSDPTDSINFYNHLYSSYIRRCSRISSWPIRSEMKTTKIIHARADPSHPIRHNPHHQQLTYLEKGDIFALFKAVTPKIRLRAEDTARDWNSMIPSM